MNYRAVLFDFDGTLTPSLPLWRRGFRITLASYGVHLSDEEVVKRCFYRPWEDVARDFGLGDTSLFCERVLAGVRESFNDAELFPLSIPLLRHCREHGLQTALVTSCPRDVLGDVMPRLGIPELFDFVISGDDVTVHKPHPEAVHRTLDALGRRPDEVIMVGDSTADILAGRSAGTATALFLPHEHNVFYCFDTLKRSEPSFVFEDHRELPGILGIPGLVTEPIVAPG